MVCADTSQYAGAVPSIARSERNINFLKIYIESLIKAIELVKEVLADQKVGANYLIDFFDIGFDI